MSGVLIAFVAIVLSAGCVLLLCAGVAAKEKNAGAFTICLTVGFVLVSLGCVISAEVEARVHQALRVVAMDSSLPSEQKVLARPTWGKQGGNSIVEIPMQSVYADSVEAGNILVWNRHGKNWIVVKEHCPSCPSCPPCPPATTAEFPPTTEAPLSVLTPTMPATP